VRIGLSSSTQGDGRRSLIRNIVSPGVFVRERWSDVDDSPLSPIEWAVVANAVPSRQREFATSRRCAREALSDLGHLVNEVPRGEGGEPVWPVGVVGALAHCHGYRAAAVASRNDLSAIGIDAEPNQPMPAGVLDVIALEAEVAELDALPRTAVSWERLLFCAKESVYKVWYPLMHSWLDFDQAHVTIDPTGRFDAHLRIPARDFDGRAIQHLTGRWAMVDSLLGTVVEIAR
jgi:4'-phosphopantetheinyl transferase EntD